MKRILLGLLLGLSSQVFAATGKDSSYFLTADLLIWKLSEGATENWAQHITAPGANASATIYGLPFSWSPGFRLGLGYKREGIFDALLSYTGYQTSTSGQASGDIYSPFLGHFYANNTDGNSISGAPHFRDANINWQLDYHVVDLTLGHVFDFDKTVKLHPFVGVKGAEIKQTITSNWNSPINTATFTTATENLKQNYWGVGPEIGLDTTWPLYQIEQRKFNLIGNLSGALMWGKWTYSDMYASNLPQTIVIHFNNDIGGSTMAAMLLAIEWTNQLKNADIALRLGYEAQIWYAQMQTYTLNLGRSNNLMSLQGGNLEFRINF